MDGIEEKLNALFSSPDSLAQIKKLAETLSGSGALPPSPGAGEQAEAAPRQSGPQHPALQLPDARLLQTISRVMQEYSAPSETAALVSALRPWLCRERAERLDKALRIAKLAKAARAVLPELGGLQL